jgi:hypothetical protein
MRGSFQYITCMSSDYNHNVHNLTYTA